MQPENATLCVVICSRNRPDMLRDALARLQPLLRPIDELVVVDSASRDLVTQEVARAAGAKVVRTELPGLSRARNAGIAATDAQLVAFTDDDCEVEAGWTSAIAHAFDDPRIGFTTGKVVPWTRANRAREFSFGLDPVVMGHGANMAFRRSALEGIGGFDEALGAGGRLHSAEDHDAFWRVLQQGWRGRHVPEAVVSHPRWRSSSEQFRNRYCYGVGGGAFIVKVARTDRANARKMLVDRLWRRGMRHALVTAKYRRWTSARAALWQVWGTLVGLARARGVPVVDGHLRPNGQAVGERTRLAPPAGGRSQQPSKAP